MVVLKFEPRSVGSQNAPLCEACLLVSSLQQPCVKLDLRVEGIGSEDSSRSIPVERELFTLAAYPPPPRLTHHLGLLLQSAIKPLSTASSDPMPGRIQQSPASACQREAHGEGASEQRAERQEEVPHSAATVLKRTQKKSHRGSWRLRVPICTSSGSHLHGKSYL